MKIIPLQGDTGLIYDKKTTSSSQQGKGVSFADCLNSICGSGATEETSSSKPVFAPGYPSMSHLTPAQEQAMAAGENTLSLVELLANRLKKSELDNSSLESLADRLEVETETLKQARDGLEINDPLRDILDSIGAMSYVEAYKITHGEYSS